MAGDVEHVVDPAHDPVVAVLVAAGAVAGEVAARDVGPVLLLIPFVVAVEGAEHRRPRLADDQEAALVGAERLAVLGDDVRDDARQRAGRRPRHRRRGARQRRDHDRAGLGLPPGVHDRAPTAADDLVIPHPRLGVDRLADRAQQAEARQVVTPRELLAPLHERPDRRRGRVEDRDPVVLDEFPEPALVGPVRRPLVHDAGGAVGERPVDEVGMARHPADVGGAPVGVVVLEVEDPLRRDRRAEQVAARGVEDALRLPGRTRGIEDVQGMFAVERLGRAVAAWRRPSARATSGRGRASTASGRQRDERRSRSRAWGRGPRRRRRSP